MEKRAQWPTIDDPERLLVHFARLALTGSGEDVSMLARKTLRSLVKSRPELAQEASGILAQAADLTLARSAEAKPVPVDLDSRLELLRRELAPTIEPEPIWAPEVRDALDLIIAERHREEDLLDRGLSSTRSLLFVGPPGVGKTLAARWLARELGRPLLTLDLAAVMSSFLGRTGNNLRSVLDFAREQPGILLLDEFDSIAKRRDDPTEVGELKRLVTVILQSVDDWPKGGLLIAATNHDELLDPAIWRRFERVVRFPPPTSKETKPLLRALLGPDTDDNLVAVLAECLEGWSFSDIENEIRRQQRAAVVRRAEIADGVAELAGKLLKGKSRESRSRIVSSLASLGLSQRRISELTGLSRTTVSRYVAKENSEGGS